MSGFARREQLVSVGRSLFAEKGFGATSVEEIAARAKVSKPVIYEHFGGKEGLYAVIVDREVQALITSLQSSLESSERPRLILENATLGLLDYIERNTDGFRVLVRDAPSDRTAGSFSSIMGDVATRVEHIMPSNSSAPTSTPPGLPCTRRCSSVSSLRSGSGGWTIDA